MPRVGTLRARIADPPNAEVAAPGGDAAAPGESIVEAPGERPLGAPQEVDEIGVSPPRSDSAEETAVAVEANKQDPAARSDSAAEAASAKEELKDPSADEPAKDGQDEESVDGDEALSTVLGDTQSEDEFGLQAPKVRRTERQWTRYRDSEDTHANAAVADISRVGNAAWYYGNRGSLAQKDGAAHRSGMS